MRQLHNCFWVIIPLFLLFGVQNKVFSQNEDIRSTAFIDSLIAVKAYEKADSVLTQNINQLKDKQYYQELTRRIYYVGKIALVQNKKEVAIKKANAFANSITNATDSLEVSRQKHLVLARFYSFLRDYKSASQQNLLALEETKKMSNATGDLFGLIHHNLSIDFRRQGNIKDAIWHSKKSIEYYLSYPKSDKSKVLDAYNSLGARMWDAFKIDSALYYFKEGEKIIDELESTPFNQFYHKAKSQSNISSVNKQLGNISEAMAYNEKAIKNYNAFIKSDAVGKDFFKEEARMFLFLTIQNYAEDFISLGNYTKARDLNEYVYQQLLIHMPENDSELGYALLNLGNVNLKLKNYDLAEEYFDKGLQIYLQNGQNNKLQLADAYYYKGIINEHKGNTKDAKIYYELSKENYESVFGSNYDEFYLKAILNYSEFYSKNGFFDEAIEMATKAYQYIIDNQGEKTISEYSQLINLAKIHFESKNHTVALSFVNKAFKIIDNPNASGANQFLANFKKPMAILLKSKVEFELEPIKDSVFLKQQYLHLKEAISILEEQKSTVIEDKNVSVILDDNNALFEFTKEIALMLYYETKHSNYLKEVLSIHESKLYHKIRQHLNVQTNFSSKDVPDSVLEEEKQLIKELNTALNNENTLDLFLKAKTNWNAFLGHLKSKYPKYYELKYASISQSLHAIDKHLPDNTSVIRYVYISNKLHAFIIEKNSVKTFELDSNALQNVLKLKPSEDQVFAKDFNSYHNLYKILWKPLSKSINHTKLIIIPDRNLFNISFETLSPAPVNSNKSLANNSLLNSYQISYNYSLLLIDKNKAPKFYEENFIAFTPEFNDQMKSNYKISIRDSVFLDKAYLTLLPQPFSKDLAKTTSRNFDGKLFSNENASKALFTTTAKEHKIIHIGTHAESNNVSPELSRLIFAKNVSDSLATDDNSLYTYEIYNQNLSSNLAILTACETGKPTYQAGEGMISLAHAFNYAGSESMLTSLWKIDEQSSTQILEKFYDYIKKGQSKDEALRNAKLDYLASAEGRTLAPQYWAGLVLIGDTAPIDLKTSSNLLYWLFGLIVLLIIIVLIKKNPKS